MKKAFIMMMVLLALPFAMQAQSKFHDVELSEAKGAVKCIKQGMMGRDIVTNFTPEGKMQREGIVDPVYDENGYMQSAKMSFQGQEAPITYKWENGRLKSQTMEMMGQQMVISRTYDEQGVVVSQTMNMGGNEMSTPYSDYKFDDHGNWISRKGSMMGQEMVETRTIEYYE